MTMLAIKWHDVVLQEPAPLRDIGPFPPENIFFGAERQEAAFGGSAGVVQGPSFTADELKRIDTLIRDQLIENARQLSQRAADAIADVPLSQYHLVADPGIHSKLLSKLGRVMNARAVSEIRQMSFFDYVGQAFGSSFYLSDEEEIGHEQICLRVVRPNYRQDVGTLHRDSWFWDHFGFHIPEGISRTKMWMQICGEPSKAGLLLAPGSHRHRADFRPETTDGKLGFVPLVDPEDVDLRRFLGAPGDPVMFNYKTLHVGALNRGDATRVSIEITIMYGT